MTFSIASVPVTEISLDIICELSSCHDKKVVKLLMVYHCQQQIDDFFLRKNKFEFSTKNMICFVKMSIIIEKAINPKDNDSNNKK